MIERFERGEHLAHVACAMSVSVCTVYKWRRRYREEDLAGLQVRSSRPLNSPARTPEAIEGAVIALCRGKRIYDLIAKQTGLSRATVGRILMVMD